MNNNGPFKKDIDNIGLSEKKREDLFYDLFKSLFEKKLSDQEAVGIYYRMERSLENINDLNMLEFLLKDVRNQVNKMKKTRIGSKMTRFEELGITTTGFGKEQFEAIGNAPILVYNRIQKLKKED